MFVTILKAFSFCTVLCIKFGRYIQLKQYGTSKPKSTLIKILLSSNATTAHYTVKLYAATVPTLLKLLLTSNIITVHYSLSSSPS